MTHDPKELLPPGFPSFPLVASTVCDAPPLPPAPTVIVSVEPKTEAGNISLEPPPPCPPPPPSLAVPAAPFLPEPPPAPPPITVISTLFAPVGFVQVPEAVKALTFVVVATPKAEIAVVEDTFTQF